MGRGDAPPFALTEEAVLKYGTLAKMNPPLRTETDRAMLIEGLKEKKIGAAGLDVYEEEAAYFYEDTSDRIMDDDILARLLSFNNVIMTSHQVFSHVKRWII